MPDDTVTPPNGPGAQKPKAVPRTSRITLVLVSIALLFCIFALYRVQRTHVRLHQKMDQLQAEQQKAEQQKAQPSGTNRGFPRP